MDIPAFELNAVLEDGVEDIAGQLHLLLYKSENKLKEMELEGIISLIQIEFLKRVKKLN